MTGELRANVWKIQARAGRADADVRACNRADVTGPCAGDCGEPAAAPQRLTLTDVPVATGKSTALFDGRSLKGWTAWLGYPDPSITYQAKPGTPPIGTSRDTKGDFAVRSVDGAPAIWVKGETWGSLVHQADLRDYHLRLQFKWGAKTWAPRATQPRNNGLLYHTHGAPGEVFGTWRPSVEFEIMTGSTGMIVAVGSKLRGRTGVTFDPSVVEPHLRFRAGGARSTSSTARRPGTSRRRPMPSGRPARGTRSTSMSSATARSMSSTASRSAKCMIWRRSAPMAGSR
ncbi:DUF1080 domain-containing protein [Sphingomonas aerolata]